MEKQQKKTTRDTSYSKTWKVIDANGLEKIKSIWIRVGMYKTAEKLQTSPYTIRYIAQKHGWTRPAKNCQHLLTAVKNGRKSASFYRSLDFSDVNINTNNGDTYDT